MENQWKARAIAGWVCAGVLLLGREGLAGVLAAWLWHLLAPFLLGGLFAFLLDLPLTAVERNLSPRLGRLRRPLALAISLLGVLAAGLLVCFLVLPQLTESLRALGQSLPRLWQEGRLWLAEQQRRYPILNQLELPDLSGDAQQLLKYLGTTVSAAGSMAGNVTDGVLGLVFACYMLVRKESLYRQLSMLVGAWCPLPTARRALGLVREVAASFRSFFAVQCLEAAILGGMLAAAMLVCRLPYAALVSVVVAVTAVIPVFGSFAGGTVGVLLILAQSPPKALWFLVVFLCVQQLEGTFVYPRVVGNTVGLPPIWVLAAVTLGGRLLGIAGMILMIPVCSVLYGLLCRATAARLSDKKQKK